MNFPFHEFYNRQYTETGGDDTRALDHGFYRYLAPFARTRNQVACQMIGDRKFKNVLELGGGTGEIPKHMIENFSRYICLDISSYQLSRIPLSIRENPRASFMEFDLNGPLPLTDGQFDLVLALSVMQYLFDPLSFLGEIRRVLKPAGELLLQVENLAFLPRRLQLLFGKLPTVNKAYGWEGGILHRFTYASLKKLLTENGFEILKFRCSGLWPELRRGWPSLLAGDLIFQCGKKIKA